MGSFSPSKILRVLEVAAIAGVLGALHAAFPSPASAAAGGSALQQQLDPGQWAFYNGRYEEAATLTAEACTTGTDLSACELRQSALLFRIKHTMSDIADRGKAWQACAICPEVMAAFLADTAKGQALARARLQANPEDEEAMFFLGKLNLNYVWLQLGTLGKKTGWGEYWEARKSLDKVLVQNPEHVRARVARAWIDYIVDTRMPRGTRWLLGGGNKKRGLRVVQEAAVADATFFAKTEAGFALWDMQVREKQLKDAVVTARRLLADFPENQGLRKFLDAHASVTG